MDSRHIPEIDRPVLRNAVQKYIAQCNKSKQKYQSLYPKCVEIFKEEMKDVEWMDECFEKKVWEMLPQAHISQLQSFYCRYTRTAKKKVFVARWLRDEL